MKLFLVCSLGLFSACSMTGWGGDNGNGDPKFAVEGPGERVLTFQQAGYTQVDGTVRSYTAGTHFRGAPAPKSVRGRIDAIRTDRDPNDHGGFDPGYSNLGIREEQKAHHADDDGDGKSRYPNAVLTHFTEDTNHDGYISGGFGGNCNFLAAIDDNSGIPASALFMDSPTCVRGQDPVADGFFFEVTDSAFAMGGYGFVNNDAEGDGDNALFDQLPFDVRVQLLNSVNTVTDVTTLKTIKDGKGGTGSTEVLHLAITGIRVGGATYQPAGVGVDLVGMKNLRVNFRSPGARLMLAWIADQLQKSLDGGKKSLDLAVTINNAVTLTSDQLIRNTSVRPLSTLWVDTFRRLATAK